MDASEQHSMASPGPSHCHCPPSPFPWHCCSHRTPMAHHGTAVSMASSTVWWFLLSLVLCAAIHVPVYLLLSPPLQMAPANWMAWIFGCQSVSCFVLLALLVVQQWICPAQVSPDLGALLGVCPAKALGDMEAISPRTLLPLDPPTRPNPALGLQQLERRFWWMAWAIGSVISVDFLWALCGVPSMWVLVVLVCAMPHVHPMCRAPCQGCIRIG